MNNIETNNIFLRNEKDVSNNYNNIKTINERQSIIQENINTVEKYVKTHPKLSEIQKVMLYNDSITCGRIKEIHCHTATLTKSETKEKPQKYENKEIQKQNKYVQRSQQKGKK